MPYNELEKKLDKLQEELKAIDAHDTEKRDMLEQLIVQIESKLNEPQKRDSLSDKLKEKVALFEASHPRIGSLLEEIIAILVRLGI